MERIRVESGSLAAVGYDEAERVLEIEFQHGGVYVYENVPKGVYEELLAADSKGRYFLDSIRDGGYRTRRSR
jgi:hypothetical protein